MLESKRKRKTFIAIMERYHDSFPLLLPICYAWTGKISLHCLPLNVLMNKSVSGYSTSVNSSLNYRRRIQLIIWRIEHSRQREIEMHIVVWSADPSYSIQFISATIILAGLFYIFYYDVNY